MKEIDFEIFCAGAGMLTPPIFMNSIIYGGYKYATDSKIIIRVPAPESKDIPRPDKCYDLDELFKKANFNSALCTTPLSIAEIKVEKVKCPDCEGTKFIYEEEQEECSNCQGTGNCTCGDCNDEHSCGKCDGVGYKMAEKAKMICPDCFGEGTVERRDTVKLESLMISADHYEKLLTLENVKFHETEQFQPTMFIADGGVEGLVVTYIQH